METNQSITIERCGNGFIVRPPIDYRSGMAAPVAEILVFQDMGGAYAERHNQASKDTLLGFIQAHFSRPGEQP